MHDFMPAQSKHMLADPLIPTGGNTLCLCSSLWLGFSLGYGSSLSLCSGLHRPASKCLERVLKPVRDKDKLNARITLMMKPWPFSKQASYICSSVSQGRQSPKRRMRAQNRCSYVLSFSFLPSLTLPLPFIPTRLTHPVSSIVKPTQQ